MKEVLLNTIYPKRKNYKKYFALVSDEDFNRVTQVNWFVDVGNNTTYVYRRMGGKKIYLHRFIMDVKQGETIDHANGNGLDNQRENLRVCTKQQNQFNMASHKDASCKYKGVWKVNKRWRSRIMIDGKHIHIGYFDTEQEAATAYNEKAKELHGNFAWLNSIEAA